jgi:DNA-binding response OmpR family regulator
MAEIRQQSGAPDRPLILLADDEHAIREALSQFLHRAGFDVLEASSGDRALELAQTRVVDLCVLDVLMPGLDGREVLRRLRRAGSFTPVLLLTQVGDAGERAMALEEGADDYLNKPFDPHELVARQVNHILVDGYTDSIGSADYNLGLSRRRAAAVQQALRAALAGAPRIVTTGHGEADPVAPNTQNGHDNPAGRAQNRRVVISFSRQ